MAQTSSDIAHAPDVDVILPSSQVSFRVQDRRPENRSWRVTSHDQSKESKEARARAYATSTHDGLVLDQDHIRDMKGRNDFCTSSRSPDILSDGGQKFP